MSDIYSMSDEEFKAHSLEQLGKSFEQESTEEDEVNEEIAVTEEDEVTEPDESENSNEVLEAEDQETEIDEELEDVDEEPDTTDEDDSVNETEETDQVDEPSNETESENTKSDEVDYKAFYESVTSSFKANKKEMSVSDPSDIKTLMQQGINYSKRMSELKPHLNILKTLENHGLLSNDKISYLIDVHNKDPKAIAKLVKDSGVDAYELDEESASEYVPTNKVQEQSAFAETVTELKSESGFDDMFNTMSNEWDQESQQTIIDNPRMLRVLHKQKQSGDFDKISGIVEYHRACGRYTDIPYIEAYCIVENELNPQTKPVETKEQKQPAFKAPRPTPKNNDARKKKVASPKNSGSVKDTFDPLKLSDEEYVKFRAQQKKY